MLVKNVLNVKQKMLLNNLIKKETTKMKNTLKLNHKDRLIVMDRTFAKLAENTKSEEYAHLQMVRKDYPNYTVAQKKINKNPNTEHYNGLTYEYMHDYIIRYSASEEMESALKELDDMIFTSQCHSKAFRYPTIKKWFLAKYPEVTEKFARKREEENKQTNVAQINKDTEKNNIAEFKEVS